MKLDMLLDVVLQSITQFLCFSLTTLPSFFLIVSILVIYPGSGSGLEDSDPLIDQILRPQDPDSVGFGHVPTTTRKAIKIWRLCHFT
jgi:hypothetical protein